jgi:hypothetical protein
VFRQSLGKLLLYEMQFDAMFKPSFCPLKHRSKAAYTIKRLCNNSVSISSETGVCDTRERRIILGGRQDPLYLGHFTRGTPLHKNSLIFFNFFYNDLSCLSPCVREPRATSATTLVIQREVIQAKGQTGS